MLKGRWLDRGPAHQLPHDPDRIGAQGAGNGEKLHDIQPSLATFVFCNERLRALQPFGELFLAQAHFFTSFGQKLAQKAIFRLMEGFNETAGPGGHKAAKSDPRIGLSHNGMERAGINNELRDYPKIG